MSDLHVEIGKRIRLARNQADMTQDELAKVIGLTRASMTNIESGFQKTPLEKLYDIAVALNTSIYNLLPETLTEDELRRFNEMRNISVQITELQQQQKKLRKNGHR